MLLIASDRIVRFVLVRLLVRIVVPIVLGLKFVLPLISVLSMAQLIRQAKLQIGMTANGPATNRSVSATGRPVCMLSESSIDSGNRTLNSGSSVSIELKQTVCSIGLCRKD